MHRIIPRTLAIKICTTSHDKNTSVFYTCFGGIFTMFALLSLYYSTNVEYAACRENLQLTPTTTLKH